VYREPKKDSKKTRKCTCIAERRRGNTAVSAYEKQRITVLMRLRKHIFINMIIYTSRSSCPCRRRHEMPSPPQILGSCVQISLEAWISVICYVFVLSGVCDIVDNPSKESYKLSIKFKFQIISDGKRAWEPNKKDKRFHTFNFYSLLTSDNCDDDIIRTEMSFTILKVSKWNVTLRQEHHIRRSHATMESTT
jgi:hypothetical protein